MIKDYYIFDDWRVNKHPKLLSFICCGAGVKNEENETQCIGNILEITTGITAILLILIAGKSSTLVASALFQKE